tara:strand:+ start:1036 stop:1653 length:618 start_codon:yes stop_codon:yes gene_type:complete
MDLIPNKIVQIFLPATYKNIREKTLFCVNKILWQQYAEKYGFQYIFICEDNIDEYLGDHKQFYNELRYNWSRVDFARYLVMNKLGGFYFDLDITPEIDMDIFDLLKKDIVLGTWIDPKTDKLEISNSVIGCRPGKLDSLILYSISEYKKKESMAIYKKWKTRFFLHTTGVRMFKRWAKKEKHHAFVYEKMYWFDHASKSWLINFN